MPVDQNQQGRRPHYNRGRRGPDRRGTDRRALPAQDQSPRSGDQLDVEQIMRDIRARIAQRHGIELSTQQIQELAARRLEAILDPRTINPSLMQQLRRGAGAAPEVPAAAADAGYSFEETTLYESHRGLLRFLRRLLNPILKLFFNPTPLVHALHTQARLNQEAAAREAERERLQTEWNALHYELVQRLVTEVSRVTVEMQSLALRVEALTGRVDFNDRRVRSLETTAPPTQARTHTRPADTHSRPAEQPSTPPAAAVAAVAAVADTPAADASSADAPGSDGARRRRRRRRGRRGSGAAVEANAPTVVVGGSEGLAGPDTADLNDGDDGDDDEMGAGPESAPTEPADTMAMPRSSTEPELERATSPSEQLRSPAEPMAPPPEPMVPPREPLASPPAELLPPPPEQLAPPPDEPAPQPPEPQPGPTDR
jgi:hypothetical protein